MSSVLFTLAYDPQSNSYKTPPLEPSEHGERLEGFSFGMDAMDWKHESGDSKEKYHLYLCSREWAQKKEAVRERCGGICEVCRERDMEVVHHLTYIRKYDERLRDLQGCCRSCHEYIHHKKEVGESMLTKIEFEGHEIRMVVHRNP